jgi:hypothetical protein
MQHTLSACPAPRRAPFTSLVEPLEDRRMMSVSVPNGYVQVQSLTLDAVTLAAQSISLSASRDYFFKATGTHVMSSPNPTLHADAASAETVNHLWSDGIRLHITNAGGTELVTWGTHATDNEYGASYHSDGNATLSAFITDSDATDNEGSLTLVVYRKVVLGTMTAEEVGGGNAVATATGSLNGTATLLVTLDASNQATVSLSALVSPNTAEALNKVAWTAYNSAGTVIASDTFDSGGDTITLTFNSRSDTFTIRAGTDTNGNGAFDFDTEVIQRTITVQSV